MPKSVAGSLRKIRCAGVFAITAFLGYPGSAGATVWQVGDQTTYGQGLWGGDPALDAGATLLVAEFDTVYASRGAAIVGSSSGFTLIFTDSASVLAYLPSIGVYAPLNGSTLDPLATSSGAFGGDVLGLELNVDFSDAGFLPAASGIPFGDLVLEGFSTLPQLDGLTVRQFLGDMNTLLSGGTSIVSIDDIGGPPDFDPILTSLNASFSSGTPNQFAQDHLVAPTPEPSSLAVLIAGLFGLAATAHRKRHHYSS